MNLPWYVIHLGVGVLAIAILLVFMKEPREALLEKMRGSKKDRVSACVFVAFILAMSWLALITVVIDVLWDYFDRKKKRNDLS